MPRLPYARATVQDRPFRPENEIDPFSFPWLCHVPYRPQPKTTEHSNTSHCHHISQGPEGRSDAGHYGSKRDRVLTDSPVSQRPSGDIGSVAPDRKTDRYGARIN